MRTVLTATLALALGAGTALAADLPSRVAPPVYVPPVVGYSWTGFEGGLHSAYVFGSDNHVRTSPAIVGRPAYLNTQKSGSSDVGVELGYNYQFGLGSGVVIGADVQADFVNLHKNAYYLAPQSLSIYHQRLDYLGTANGKIGYAFDRFLVYGTGGFAFGDPGYGGTFFTQGKAAAFGGNNGGLKGGYDFGGGAAYAIPSGGLLDKFSIERYIGLDKLLGNFSTVLKVEYVHYNLGSQSVGLTGIAGGPNYTLNYHTEGNMVRGGLLYQFLSTPAPVVARY